ncbi:thiolase family protein [Microbacter sp. GSS18]|nr:thiolase family protein [Microbacter sp. GSS18]
MAFDNVFIPIPHIWSTPFTKWQGALAEVNALDLAVDVTARALEQRETAPGLFTHWALGMTVIQKHSFYGVTLVTRRLGAGDVAGPWISRACATSAAVVDHLATQVQLGRHRATLGVLTDRTSNAPLMIYPSARGMGGAPQTEHWMLDNFSLDPTTGQSMLDTAENTARDGGFTREQVDELTLLRNEQYRRALADDRAFQRRYMVDIHIPGRKGTTVISEDGGVFPTTAEGLAALRPATEGGVTTFGSQTHPADAAAGIAVTDRDTARELGGGATAQILGTGFGRAEPAFMPKAPVQAAAHALDDAGLDLDAIDLVTTHNPFAVNDLWFAHETGYDLERMNVYGSSLVYGHPQAPTGARAIAELIHALHERGGGYGLFVGCAAGDDAGGVVIKVDG